MANFAQLAAITSHGHRKRDAIRIRELIETYQATK